MSDVAKQSALNAAQQELMRSDARHKLIANALPSNGSFWTVLLIARPADKQEMRTHDRNEVVPDNQESNTTRRVQDISQVQAHESQRSGYIYHNEGKDALLGFGLFLLLDAVFRLWAYADSFPSSPEIAAENDSF